eukprot:c18044_g1_i2 orf=124-2769(-)
MSVVTERVLLSSEDEEHLDSKLDPGSDNPGRRLEVLSYDQSAEHQNLSALNGYSLRREEKALETKALTALPGDKEGSSEKSCDSALWLGDAKSIMLRASISSLPAVSKDRFHSVSKGAGIGKHMNARGVGRASKLAHLEVAAEHLGPSSHVLLASPRLLRSPGRKKSPIRWFPRKKTESYLERKIRMLQEREGNIVSLDETLGAANPHLSRIEREKLAAQAAAAEAKDARKGALIEASWCRILKLAGIPCKSAILELQKAEKKASAAMAEAEIHGVILQHGPGEREPASEAITASLDTAFEVDKEVAAAIKVALKVCSRSPTRSTERECDSQSEPNTERTSTGDMAHYVLEINSEAESQSDPENKDEWKVEQRMSHDGVDSPIKILSSGPHCRNQQKPLKVKHSLVSLMVSRTRDLSVEYQTALAGIVATRGLSALLKEQSLEQELDEKTADSLDSKPLSNGCCPKKGSDLGSILVKHVSRLQREVQASKETNRHLQMEVEKKSGGRLQRVAQVDSLDQILVKHVSKLEKEKLAAQAARTPPKKKMNSAVEEEIPGLSELLQNPHEHNEAWKEVKEENQNFYGGERIKLSEVTNTPHSTPDLGSTLVKHVSSLEKEKQAAFRMSVHPQDADLDRVQVETVEAKGFNSGLKKNRPPDFNEISDLGSILVKHVSRLEKEKQVVALAMQEESRTSGRKVEKGKQSSEVGLGDILVKRLSKLEIEKARLSMSRVITPIGPTGEGAMSREKELLIKENSYVNPMSGNLDKENEHKKIGGEGKSGEAPWQRANAHRSRQMESTWGGLALQDAFPSAKSTSGQSSNKGKTIDVNLPRLKSLREKQMEDAWGGLSLGNALKRHVSKLEKEQAAWRLAEEEAGQRPNLQQ